MHLMRNFEENKDIFFLKLYKNNWSDLATVTQ